MTNLILKLNQEIKSPVLTVGLNGHTKSASYAERDFIDLHQSLDQTHRRATLMEIDLAKKQFTPAEKGHVEGTRSTVPLTPGEPQKLPSSNSYVVFDKLVRLRIALEPAEAFDDKDTRYELITDDFKSGDKDLLHLVSKYHDDTNVLVSLGSFAGYLFHLAAVDVPDLAPELRAPPADADEKTRTLLASMGQISKAEVKSRLQQRIDEFPGDEADKEVLRKARYWVTETLQDKDERFAKVNKLTSQIDAQVANYLADGRRLDKTVEDFFARTSVKAGAAKSSK